MNKLEYLQECLKRNPNLRGDVLIFHQQFPPVFAWVRKRTKQPDWLLSILEPSGLNDAHGNPLYIGRPKKLEDLKTLHSMSIAVEGFHILMVGEGKYYDVVKKKPHEYNRALRTYLEKWPEINRATFLHSDFEPYRPPLLVSDLPLSSGTLGDLKADLSRLADRVKIWIPVYEDTSSDDVSWGRIASLQAFIYGTKRRARKDVYSKKLEVWDTYQDQDLQNYAVVGRKLNLPRRTVEELYISVFKDIMGVPLSGKMRERRVKGIDGKSHFAECEQCKKGKLCPTGEVLVNVNSGYQREIFRLPDDNLLPSNHETEGQAGQQTRHKTKKAIIREVFTCRKCKRRFLMYYPPKTCVDHKREEEI